MIGENAEENKVIDLADYKNQKHWKEVVMGGLEAQMGHAREVAFEFVSVLEQDPMKAIRQLNSYIDKAREHRPDARGWESMAGGPCEHVTAPFLDAVGMIYPGLDREAQEYALKQCLGFLDGQNSNLVQQNMEYIDEPWLVRDIIFNRWIYSCGYDRYKKAFADAKTWAEFQPHVEKAASKFWITYPVTKPDMASLDIRVKFPQHYPNLFDRTLDFLAAWCYKYAFLENFCDGKPYGKTLKRLIEKYDTSLHDRLYEKVEEQKWITLVGGREQGDIANKVMWSSERR